MKTQAVRTDSSIVPLCADRTENYLFSTVYCNYASNEGLFVSIKDMNYHSITLNLNGSSQISIFVKDHNCFLLEDVAILYISAVIKKIKP